MTNRIAVSFSIFTIALITGIGASFLSYSSALDEAVVEPVPVNGAASVADLRSADPPVGPSEVQTANVRFKASGEVTVSAIEDPEGYPIIDFTSTRTGARLLHAEIADKEKWLLGKNNFVQMRFTVLDGVVPSGPAILAVGVNHGGSDDAFLATVFCEIDGRITRLNDEPYFANIQGGYDFANFGSKLGTGLAVWSFIWGDSSMESHYSDHRYRMDLYHLKGSKLVRTLHRSSKRMYPSDKANESLRELGIKATDQRKRVPEIKELIDLEP